MKNNPRRFSIAILATLLLSAVPAIASDGSGAANIYSGHFDLEKFGDLSAAFNEQEGDVRLVALLSASCGYCIKGYRYMRKLLEEWNPIMRE